ncbi:hypothetical protein TAMC210_04090 [Thermanaeromonas sp. C210]|nr:hypothetical protein TAMC210_04090 [Thermanaeromonas sp. C210]
MALFGFLGFLVLASSYYVLTREKTLKDSHVRRVKLCLILLNVGLGIMAVNLIIAGFLQTYLVRGAGMDFGLANFLLRPYLLLRGLGGMVFAAGALLLAWEMASTALGRRH